MNTSVTQDEKGRKYQSLHDENSGLSIPVGPPEGLVDSLGWPEPFATNLHNALFRRGLLNYGVASKRSGELIGALQEALEVDAQKVLEAYFMYEHQEVSHE
jgi:hypothetical protein